MSKAPEITLPEPQLQQPRQAGDVEPFPSGRITYLAPLPLPTQLPPQCPYVGELNDVYLDFGLGSPQVFSWQVTLGGPFNCFVAASFVLPLILGLIAMSVGAGSSEAWAVVVGTHRVSWGLTVGVSLCALATTLLIWFYVHNKYEEIIPTRFNRQRREVCFVPNDESEPVIVPWESVTAWVIQAQGANQYGVQRQYGMGVGFYHEASGERFTLEFVCPALPIAISNWEAIRAYMEYEVHTLKEITDPLDLQGPDDPPHEGLHTFRNARARLHQEIRDKQRGWVYGFFWYLFHVMTFWTLPFYLTEWEVGRVKRMARQALPEAMRDWSEPLPKEQWAKPSPELLRMSAQVRALHKRNPQRPITEMFAEVYRAEKSGKRSA
jgi:hypothetical protein